MSIYAERLGEYIRISVAGIRSHSSQQELLSRREALRLVRELLEALDVDTRSASTDLQMSPSIEEETPPGEPST